MDNCVVEVYYWRERDYLSANSGTGREDRLKDLCLMSVFEPEPQIGGLVELMPEEETGDPIPHNPEKVPTYRVARVRRFYTKSQVVNRWQRKLAFVHALVEAVYEPNEE